MERARRVRLLISRAKELVETGGDREETLQAMRAAIQLLRSIESDMTQFIDRLSPDRRQAQPRPD
jgi:hypothetical protein